MDKEEATKILAKELGDKVGREIVIENTYKEALVKNASEIYQLDKPSTISKYDAKNRDYFLEDSTSKGTLEKILHLYNKNANYYFLEKVSVSSRGSYDLCFVATPYALIGEKEKKDLRRLFYKNVKPQIIHAFNLLGIENFIELYRHYSKGFEEVHYLPTSLNREDRALITKFINFISNLSYDGHGEVKVQKIGKFKNITALNNKFEEIGMKSRISKTKYRNRDVVANHPEYIHKKNLDGILYEINSKFKEEIKSQQREENYFYEDNLSDGFLDLIFSLPYEDQNIVLNKEFLHHHKDLDFVYLVICEEYIKGGKYFCEYFDVLEKSVKEHIVRNLKNFSERNPVFDSFLWNQGFKDVDLDYMNLYNEDAKGFIKYFKSRDVEEKKVILEDIYQCKFTNQEVTDWLDAKEPKLVKEVGLQNG